MANHPRAGLKLGIDPLGGSGIAYWQRIAEHYRLDLTLVNDRDRPDVPLYASRS